MPIIQELNIQKNPSNFINPVRVLRCTSENELLSTTGVFDAVELQDKIRAFKREFPRGKVQIEIELFIRPYRATDDKWLFR